MPILIIGGEVNFKRRKGKRKEERFFQGREANELRQKERKQLNEQKASVTEKEKSLDDKERKVKNSLISVLDLLMEGNEKMKSAVEKDDLSKVATAQLIHR